MKPSKDVTQALKSLPYGLIISEVDVNFVKDKLLNKFIVK